MNLFEYEYAACFVVFVYLRLMRPKSYGQIYNCEREYTILYEQRCVVLFDNMSEHVFGISMGFWSEVVRSAFSANFQTANMVLIKKSLPPANEYSENERRLVCRINGRPFGVG